MGFDCDAEESKTDSPLDFAKTGLYQDGNACRTFCRLPGNRQNARKHDQRLPISSDLISDLRPQMLNAVIQVDKVSKQYRLGMVGSGTLSHDLNRWWCRARGRPDPYLKVTETNDRAHKGNSEFVWALEDITFEVKRGEVLGIIGANGAGKSTLLKILSRVTAPTTGEVRIKGRIAALLEVGTGFHPELTGRDNVYLNGAILGMTKAEIRGKLDEIIEFSGCERYIDTPVKRYSSGMVVRLGFAVAAHLEPEIMIVDEVLAVGDASFQKRCLGKMGDVARGGRTILFVSHNMTAIQTLCARALVLGKGQLVADGPTAPMVQRYLREIQGPTEERHWTDPQAAPGNELIRIKRVRVIPDVDTDDGLLTMQTPLRIETEYWATKSGMVAHITYHLINDQGIVVLTTGSGARTHQSGTYRAVCRFPANLLNSGGYHLKFLAVHNENKVVYQHEKLASFTIVDAARRDHAYMGREPGVIQVTLPWTTEKVDS